VDVCVTKGILQRFAVAKSCFDLSSDHSSVLITMTTHALNQEKQRSLSNRHTNWDDFRYLINQRLTLNVSLKTKKDIEAAVKFFNDTVQWAGWNATPEHTDRSWHRLRRPENKRLLNIATQELKLNRNKNDCIHTFLARSYTKRMH
jgi:hypothetical protein